MPAQRVLVVYCLRTGDARRTYVGVTSDLKRRLRQHNRDLKSGGARATRVGTGWTVVYTLEGLPDRHTALQVEWRLHRPCRGPRLAPVARRVAQLHDALALRARVTATATPTAELGTLTVVWRDVRDRAAALAQGTWPANVTHRAHSCAA